MVQRLLNAHLGKAEQDDRDHYGKKRLDMAGALLAQLFRERFRFFVKQGSEGIRNFFSTKKYEKGREE
jgi:DNA-directed RNA polymerase II subunit RPB2